MRSMSDNNKMVTIFRAVYFILAGMLFILPYLYKSHFLAGCLISLVLFGFLQIWLIFMSRKDKAYQKRKCKLIGLMLLIPALGMIANGIGLIFLVDTEIPIHLSYGTIGILAVMTIGLTAHIFIFRKDSSLAARFLRLTDGAALSSPVSLIVLLALASNSDEGTAVIGCMSAVLLGVMAFLIAVNLIVISFCGYKSTRDSIETIANLMRSKKLTISRAMLAKKAIRKEVRGWKLQLKSDKDLYDIANMFNRQIHGWINYYTHFYKSEIYGALRYINEYLLKWVRRKFFLNIPWVISGIRKRFRK